MQREHVPNGDGERSVKRTRTLAEETSTQALPEAADLVSSFPPEMQSHIISAAPLEKIGLMSRTNRYWYGFLSQTFDWKILIERDFDIPMQTLTQFAQLVEKIEPGLIISFATIYQCLHRLKKQAEKDARRFEFNAQLINACMQPPYHLSMLAICLNQSSVALLTGFIPRDEKVMWLTIAIFAHANNNLALLSDTNSILPGAAKNYIFYKIRFSDNPGLIDFLFDPIFGFNFTPERHGFGSGIVVSGNLTLLQTFIERSLLQPNQLTLDDAAYHNIEMFDYVATTLEVTCHVSTNLSAVQKAGYSGNFELIKHVATRLKQPPDKITLDKAAFTGKATCVHQLIEEYKLKPDHQTLFEAARSGNSKLTEYLADTYQLTFTVHILNQLAWCCSPAKLVELIKKYNLKPNQETLRIIAYQADLTFLLEFITEHRLHADNKTLNKIARSGRLDVLSDFINKSALTPDIETLRSACDSGNLDMILYLVNTFNLALDIITCSVAAYSRNWYRVLRYHLEQVRVMIDENRIQTDEKTVLLFHAALAMQRAFSALPSRDFYVARTQLSLAAQYSPRHFFAVAVRAVLSLAAYQLDAESVDILLNTMRSAATLPVSIMEASEIYSLLLDSCDERLQTLAEAFAPLADECDSVSSYMVRFK